MILRKSKLAPLPGAYGVTHVLSWEPPTVLGGGYGWALRTRADYAAGRVPAKYAWMDAGRNADPAALAQWVSQRLGRAVRLGYCETAMRHVIFPLRDGRAIRTPWHHIEPIYYVRPA